MSFLIKKRQQRADVSPMTSSTLAVDPEGFSGEPSRRADDGEEKPRQVDEVDEVDEVAAPSTGDQSGRDALPSTTIANFGTLHFDESVVGLALCDVSVVLVGDFPVAVPISRSLAKTCGFVVLDVDDEVLKSIGVVDIVVEPEPIPPRPVLPTIERAFVASGRVQASGTVSAPPRSASDVVGETDAASLDAHPQRPVDLAPAPLASPRGLETVLDEPVAPAEPLWDKLARRSPDLALPPEPASLDPGFEAADSATATPEELTGLHSTEATDVARPFATHMATRVDVGFIDPETWPDVERRLNERDEPITADRDFSDAILGDANNGADANNAENADPDDDEAVTTDVAPASFQAVYRGLASSEPRGPSPDDAGIHPGMVSPLAPRVETPVDDSPAWDPPRRTLDAGPEPVWPQADSFEVEGLPIIVEGAVEVDADLTRPVPDELRESLGLVARPTGEGVPLRDAAHGEPPSGNVAVWSQGAERNYPSGLRLTLEDFSVDEGQLCVIFDSAGTSRSSLCRILAGFEPIDRGRLRVGPSFLESLSPDDRLIREAGSLAFADNEPLMVGDLTVAENLELPLLISRRDPAESRQLVLDTLEDFDMVDLADRLVQELPKSETVRLGVLRAILSGDVVVLDDPAADGDTVARSEILEWIRVATGAGITVIYATSEFDMSARLTGEPDTILYELFTDNNHARLRPINIRRT